MTRDAKAAGDQRPEETRPAESGPADSGDMRGPGLDHIAGEDAAQLPEDDVAIKLPIEEGDFDAQSR